MRTAAPSRWIVNGRPGQRRRVSRPQSGRRSIGSSLLQTSRSETLGRCLLHWVIFRRQMSEEAACGKASARASLHRPGQRRCCLPGGAEQPAPPQRMSASCLTITTTNGSLGDRRGGDCGRNSAHRVNTRADWSAGRDTPPNATSGSFSERARWLDTSADSGSFIGARVRKDQHQRRGGRRPKPAFGSPRLCLQRKMSTGTGKEGRKERKAPGSFLRHLTTNHYVVMAID